jgi:hypothetical protein
LGSNGVTLLFSNTWVLSATTPTLISFNYNGVTRVDFISSGGTQHSGYPYFGTQFVMDNVTIGTSPVFTGVRLLTGGSIQLTMTGSSGDVYRVLGSTNLLTWQTIASVTNITGIVQFTDPTATNYNRRFYRLALP